MSHKKLFHGHDAESRTWRWRGKEVDWTYLPPFLSSFTLSNLCHVIVIVIPNVSHMRNQEMFLLEEMDRVVFPSALAQSLVHRTPLLPFCPFPAQLSLPCTAPSRLHASTLMHVSSALEIETHRRHATSSMLPELRARLPHDTTISHKPP